MKRYEQPEKAGYMHFGLGGGKGRPSGTSVCNWRLEVVTRGAVG